MDEDLKKLINSYAEKSLHHMMWNYDPTGLMDNIATLALHHGMPATEAPIFMFELINLLDKAKRDGEKNE